jgi:hypothetical protein
MLRSIRQRVESWKDRDLSLYSRAPFDLLAGSDWHRYRKEMAPLWRSLLSAWDGMQSSMINCGRLSLSVGLALSVSHL